MWTGMDNARGLSFQGPLHEVATHCLRLCAHGSCISECDQGSWGGMVADVWVDPPLRLCMQAVLLWDGVTEKVAWHNSVCIGMQTLAIEQEAATCSPGTFGGGPVVGVLLQTKAVGGS